MVKCTFVRIWWDLELMPYCHTRSNIMRSATECAGQLLVNVLFAHPEVGELDVALLGQHDVVKLQVPVHNALAVQEQES